MKTIILYSNLIISALVLCSCGEKIEGTYQGLCQNTTFGGQAEMLLVINESSQRVDGNLTLSGDLVGGGKLSGRVDGDRISFTTTSADWGEISWTGERNAQGIQGVYYIEAKGGLLGGTPAQQGVWKVSKR